MRIVNTSIAFKLLGFASILSLSYPSASAQTTKTSDLKVQMTIVGGCDLKKTTDITFADASLLSSDTNATGAFEVTCTKDLPYTISLGPGGGASINARRMISGSETINYQLYRDANHSQIWGDTANDRAADSGTSIAKTYTV